MGRDAGQPASTEYVMGLHSDDAASQRRYLVKIPPSQRASTYIENGNEKQRDNRQSHLQQTLHEIDVITLSGKCLVSCLLGKVAVTGLHCNK